MLQRLLHFVSLFLLLTLLPLLLHSTTEMELSAADCCMRPAGRSVTATAFCRCSPLLSFLGLEKGVPCAIWSHVIASGPAASNSGRGGGLPAGGGADRVGSPDR